MSRTSAYEMLENNNRMRRTTITSSVDIPDGTYCYYPGPDATLEFLTTPDEHVVADAFEIIVGDYLSSHLVSTLFGGKYTLQTEHMCSPWLGDFDGNPDSPHGFIYSEKIGSSELLVRFADETIDLDDLLYKFGGSIDVYDVDAFNGWLSHLSNEKATIIRNAMLGGERDDKTITVRLINRETGETARLAPTKRARTKRTQFARRR